MFDVSAVGACHAFKTTSPFTDDSVNELVSDITIVLKRDVKLQLKPWLHV